MAGASIRESLRQIQRLFGDGTVAGLPDDSLLRRFASRRDEEAFSSLVARHGPMVLGVCRGVLRDPNDAEDAFQATFLTLARKARSIRPEGSLGGWLHRVARRTASKANARAIRRRGRECPEPEPDQVAGRVQPDRDEAAPALHEEIDRLPESYRRPLILCALEGLTHAEAARELGIGEATVRRRLLGAKERLRARLGRRGFALPSSLATASTTPPSWIATASKIAAGRAAPAGVAGLVPSIASARLPWLAAGLVGLGLAGFVAGRPEKPADPPPKPEIPKSVAQALAPPPRPKSEDEFTFQGQVFDPAGKPFAGAAIFARPNQRPSASTTASDAEGRFQLTFDIRKGMRSRYLTDGRVDGQPLPDFGPWVEKWPELIGVAPGFGFGVASAGPENRRIVRLVEDQPVEGRVVDLQGQPVAGASVRVRGLLAPKQGDLAHWLEAARTAADANEFRRADSKFLSLLGRHREGLSAAYPALLPSTTTGPDGRFRIAGIGRERVAWVAIEKPGIESRLVAVATHPGLASFVAPSPVAGRHASVSNPRQNLAIHGPRFDHVAGPGRAVEGSVVEKDTGTPIVGVWVVPDLRGLVELTEENRYQTVTDVRGHYRVEGLPEGISRSFTIRAPRDQPFLEIERRVAVGRGPSPPVVADFALRRGVWVEGRVLDGPAGKPVPGAQILQRVFADNPYVPQSPDRPAYDTTLRADEDGRYRIAVYPGRGLLTVFAGFRDGYAHGTGADAIPGQRLEFGRMAYPTLPEAVSPENVHLVTEVNPAEGSGPIALDLALQKARVREGRAIAPDGPVNEGLFASGLVSWMSSPQKVEGGRVEVKGLSPGEERRVVVRFDEKRLIGLAVVKAAEDGPFEVRLEPWATLEGRLVDDAGKPRSRSLTIDLRDDQRLPIYAKGCANYSQKPSPFLVDEAGRFRAEALLPGQPYDLEVVQGGFLIVDHAAKGLVLRPGEAKDLGDVTVKAP